ncbi:MAG: hypothetical protein LW825_01735 [Candidatus Jidaibacter sp.]|jgi:hypothetical protein|nr:hypothetical protein [Candidatus Jidaibacter sp.]
MKFSSLEPSKLESLDRTLFDKAFPELQLANELLSFFVDDDWDKQKLERWDKFLAANNLLLLKDFNLFHECTTTKFPTNQGQVIAEDFRLANIPALAHMQWAPFRVICDLFDREIIPTENKNLLEGNTDSYRIYQEYQYVKENPTLKYQFFKKHHYYEELLNIFVGKKPVSEENNSQTQRRPQMITEVDYGTTSGSKFLKKLFEDFKIRSQDNEKTDEDKVKVFKEFWAMYLPAVYKLDLNYSHFDIDKLEDKVSDVSTLITYFNALKGDQLRTDQKNLFLDSLKTFWPALIYHLWDKENGWSHFFELFKELNFSYALLSENQHKALDIFLTYVKEHGKMTPLEFDRFVNKVFSHKRKIQTTIIDELMTYYPNWKDLEVLKKYGLKETFKIFDTKGCRVVDEIIERLPSLSYFFTCTQWFFDQKLYGVSSVTSTILAITAPRIHRYKYDTLCPDGKILANVLSFSHCTYRAYSFIFYLLPLIDNLYNYAPVFTRSISPYGRCNALELFSHKEGGNYEFTGHYQNTSPQLLEKMRYLMLHTPEVLVDNVRNLNVSLSSNIYYHPEIENGSLLSTITDSAARKILINPDFKITSDLNRDNIFERALISPYSTCLTVCNVANILFLARSFTSKYVTGVRGIDDCLFQANRLINLVLYPVDSLMSLWCTTTHKICGSIASLITNPEKADNYWIELPSMIVSYFAFSFVARTLDSCAQSYFMAQG